MKLRSKMPPQSNKNTSTPVRTFNQDIKACLNGINNPSASNLISCSELTSKLIKDEPHNSSGFLRIQSPINNYNSISSNTATQHKNNTVSNFADAFESSFKQNNVTSNSVPFDSMFQHASTVMVITY